ncbi:hypothetical protein [Natrinema gelatinilyticum]|nr:hypothetical protein [Natrinema gelatinilyticum]
MKHDGHRRKRARLWAALYVRLFGAGDSTDAAMDEEERNDADTGRGDE